MAGAKAPIIDPTKNVIELVHAESKYQDAMREAETRRVNELARMRDKYEERIADILREEVRSTSSLVSTQLDRLTTTLSERIAALERFRWEVGGKTTGQSQVGAWIITGITLLLGAAATAITFIVRLH